VQEELQLTNEQKLMFGQILTEAMKKRLEAFKDAKGVKAEDVMKKIADANRAAVENIVKTMTPQQQAKWKQMVGKPYDGVLPAVPPGLGGVGTPRLP